MREGPVEDAVHDQSWFWSPAWQRRERAADRDIEAGRLARSEDVESFLAELDRGA